MVAMKALAFPIIALAALLLAPVARAAEASDDPVQRAEPRVQRIVVEDDTNRIDELRVRGQTQRIVVTPKGGKAPAYEIITGDGSREMFDGANTSRGAAGKRVWHVLSF